MALVKRRANRNNTTQDILGPDDGSGCGSMSIPCRMVDDMTESNQAYYGNGWAVTTITPIKVTSSGEVVK